MGVVVAKRATQKLLPPRHADWTSDSAAWLVTISMSVVGLEPTTQYKPALYQLSYTDT